MLNPNPQKPATQAKAIAALKPCLVDLLDLAASAKLASWHVRGPLFLVLRKLFSEFSATCCEQADRVAERCVLALGGTVLGTARQIAEESSLDDFPAEERDAAALCAVLTAMTRETSAGIQAARDACTELGDVDTAKMLQGVALAIEHGAGLIAAHVP